MNKSLKEKIREEEKAENEIEKEKGGKKKRKELAKQARKTGDGTEVERMLSELTLDGSESECLKCGLLYSADEENLWVYCDSCFSWFLV